MGRYDYHIDGPAFIGLDQLEIPKQNILILNELFSPLESISPTLLIRIGIDECKFNAFDKFVEGEIKFEN